MLVLVEVAEYSVDEAVEAGVIEITIDEVVEAGVIEITIDEAVEAGVIEITIDEKEEVATPVTRLIPIPLVDDVDPVSVSVPASAADNH